jgi:hypothetical protein
MYTCLRSQRRSRHPQPRQGGRPGQPAVQGQGVQDQEPAHDQGHLEQC